MPYTLMKGLAWILLALLLGIVIGWLLRSVVAKRQVARARNHHVDTVEMERLRGRVANLEPIIAERDRLRADLDAARRGTATHAAGGAPAEGGEVPAVAAALSGGLDAVVAPAARAAPAPPDVSTAAAVLGRSIALDDLKAVEGVGPKIEELCNGIGIRTWFDLATTEVSLLRTMLADAGPRFRTHDPGTWPEQARLLAEGRWSDFKTLVDGLGGGRAVESAAVESAAVESAAAEPSAAE
jgi:predicted flap endonuclease-1-like 5' DNA nuclease